jgi:GNAT superfamily N-acetyltransferase
MMTPNLSPPTLFTPSELKSNPTLSKSITQLVNDAFHRSMQTDPVKWSNESSRFTNEDGLHLLLSGAGSVIALIFDEAASAGVNEKDTIDGGQHRKIVACAAAVPWKGGWAKEGADTETGWEIKIVCVDGHPEYHHRGLAVQLLNFLEKYLVARERTRLQKEGRQGEGVLGLWILAAECLNGVYWRKRGFHEVRNKVEGPGVWSCKTSFDMVVLRKDVRFDVDADSVVQQ